jgi:hypothetical protein
MKAYRLADLGEHHGLFSEHSQGDNSTIFVKAVVLAASANDFLYLSSMSAWPNKRGNQYTRARRR